MNEELATVYAELQNKVADLFRANNDMNNLLVGTGIATVFVDLQRHIISFTPTATERINFQHDLWPREVEVQTRAGVRFPMNIQLYRTPNNGVGGAVITFTDITSTKQAWMKVKERERQSDTHAF